MESNTVPYRLWNTPSDDVVHDTAPPSIPSVNGPQPNFFQRAIDSFKRPPPSEDVFIELNESNRENINGNNVEKSDSGLHRTLKNRHLQMIAIGGSIGTGLFVGSGSALATGGPAALIIGFGLIGLMLFNVCMALGELSVVFPISGSFNVYSSRFLDPAWGFAMGWNYGIGWLTVMPLELTAAGIVINYWSTSINIAVWITIFLIVLLIINLFGARGYGEIEFFISLIKVVAVIGFIILGVVLVVGGGPTHEYLGENIG